MDVSDFLASQGYSLATKQGYARIFARIFDSVDLEGLGAADLVRLIEAQGWGNSQQCVAVAAARKYLRWRFGPSHPALAARIKARKPKPQRTLTIERALELLMSFDGSYKGRRDLALAALLLDTGLRASEVCRLQLADMDLERRSLQVIIKGGQWGAAVYGVRTGDYLGEYLSLRKPAPGVGAVFVSTHGGGQLTREGLQTIVKGWGARLGIRLSPHDFRRSYATIASVYGAPSRLVQIGGRWSSIEMVEHYTRALPADAIRPYLPVDRLTV